MVLDTSFWSPNITLKYWTAETYARLNLAKDNWSQKLLLITTVIPTLLIQKPTIESNKCLLMHSFFPPFTYPEKRTKKHLLGLWKQYSSVALWHADDFELKHSWRDLRSTVSFQPCPVLLSVVLSSPRQATEIRITLTQGESQNLTLLSLKARYATQTHCSNLPPPFCVTVTKEIQTTLSDDRVQKCPDLYPGGMPHWEAKKNLNKQVLPDFTPQSTTLDHTFFCLITLTNSHSSWIKSKHENR